MSQPDAVNDRWDKGRGGDQVDVFSTLLLQIEKDLCQGVSGYLCSQAAVADLMILAEAALQSAAREKYGTGSLLARDRRFFSEVNTGPGKTESLALLAEAPVPAGSIRTASAGAEIAEIVVSLGGLRGGPS